MPKLGRPLALDETNKKIACAVVSMGGSIENAAARIGCAPRTVNRHLRRDERFREKFQAARLQGATVPFELIRRASERNWRCSDWLLERLRPEKYGKRRSNSASRHQPELEIQLKVLELLVQAIKVGFAARVSTRVSTAPD